MRVQFLRTALPFFLTLTALAGCQTAPKFLTVSGRDPRFAPLRSIKGRVLWPDSLDRRSESYRGTPLSGVEVACYRLGRRLELFPETITNERGEFSLDKLGLYLGERFSLVVSRNGRRYVLVRVRRVPVGQRGGSRMDRIDRSERFNVIDSTRPISGVYDLSCFRVLAKRVERARPPGTHRSDEAKALLLARRKKGKQPKELVGRFADKTWSGVELYALPIVLKGKSGWSDSGAAPDWPEPGVGSPFDLLLDNLSPSLKGSLAARLEQTYFLDPKLESWDDGAIARTGLRRCDLLSLADGAPMSIPSGGTYAQRRMTATRIPALVAPAPELPELEGRTIVLSPGHGFFLRPKAARPARPRDWLSPRTFIDRKSQGSLVGPGILEDDISSQVARLLLPMLEANGAEVIALRELRDMTREGIVHDADFGFKEAPEEGPRDLPRLWEQSAKYYVAATWPELLGTPKAPLPWGLRAPVKAPHPADRSLDDNGKSVRLRVEALRAIAAEGSVDAFVAIHSNATGGAPVQSKARGSVGFYLDVASSPGRIKRLKGGAVRFEDNINQSGERLSKELIDALSEIAGTKNRGIVGLSRHGKGISVLRDTWPHDYLVPKDNRRNKTARFIRVGEAPKGSKRALMAPYKLGAKTKGWYRAPFPQKIPVSLVELAFHDNRDDAQLLEQGWFQRRLAEGIARGLARFFKAQEEDESD